MGIEHKLDIAFLQSDRDEYEHVNNDEIQKYLRQSKEALFEYAGIPPKVLIGLNLKLVVRDRNASFLKEAFPGHATIRSYYEHDEQKPARIISVHEVMQNGEAVAVGRYESIFVNHGPKVPMRVVDAFERIRKCHADALILREYGHYGY